MPLYILCSPNVHLTLTTLYIYIHRPDCSITQRHTQFWAWYSVMNMTFMSMCHMVSLWLTVTLSVFRYIFVCRHQLASTMCSMRRARVTISGITIGCILMTVPQYLIYTVSRAIRAVYVQTPTLR